MRQDQFDKLQALEEKLTDVFLGEAEPDKWPGHTLEPGTMDQQTRGDRYWCKKNAVATLSLIQRVGGLVHTIQIGSAVPPPVGVDPQTGEDEKQLDGEIASAEKEANRLLDQLQRRSRKTEFDQRTHGKT
jgi:hypothetical protein